MGKNKTRRKKERAMRKGCQKGFVSWFVRGAGYLIKVRYAPVGE